MFYNILFNNKLTIEVLKYQYLHRISVSLCYTIYVTANYCCHINDIMNLLFSNFQFVFPVRFHILGHYCYMVAQNPATALSHAAFLGLKMKRVMGQWYCAPNVKINKVLPITNKSQYIIHSHSNILHLILKLYNCFHLHFADR